VGIGAYKNQVLDSDASVVEMLRDAGAVLIAKLTTGELAQGDNWFGGQTKNPWNLYAGSSGSSAGPASATAAGCVAFGIGSETSGSILSPSGRCGITGLRPTFGRISRYGVMTLSWTQDRLGPLCRYAEDCGIGDECDRQARRSRSQRRRYSVQLECAVGHSQTACGFIKEAFDETRDPLTKEHDQKTLDQLQSLGVKLVEVQAPDVNLDTVRLQCGVGGLLR